MSVVDADFADLMQRVRNGVPDAVREVCDRYGGHVRRVVRRKLHQRLRSQYDSVDFVQAVWTSFITVPLDQYTFSTPNDLVRFLARMACNKVMSVFRQRVMTKKRDVNREQPMGATQVVQELAARQPTPSQFVMADERWQRLVDGLAHAQLQVAELLRQGHTHEEIARRMNVHPKSIQRFVRKLAERIDP